MRQQLLAQGQLDKSRETNRPSAPHRQQEIVLEKSIFSNVFDKDIRRVYMYKKAERLAKAIHLLLPAFTQTPMLRDRIDTLSIALVDAAIRPPQEARMALSRELLALSSMIGIARTSGLLSAMNADLISKETHYLLQEVAGYEEPRIAMDDAPSIADLAKSAVRRAPSEQPARMREPSLPTRHNAVSAQRLPKGHIKDRREALLSFLRDKDKGSIKDISRSVPGVSEKTVQRELAALVAEGVLVKEGERRWSTYSLA
ncbi:hypothetical protein COU19_02205 [Candidatus Kaiserbacteria bacterium CG10_big_fil_rev_8_21_14_0_10_56_12]|uniref:HTH deoR-type domain-containing protein n=1 Tax=Candidatus Kaiserbacteria bacterium CG10_big_fil_rev_8_21_14_0_10_56_12 TaxID=1974611 RepID=A0A2H0U9I7_9BACT|nr:MAG: hypothetical protein COU19_02205 [Candidatus Kaiserbacteria bacterium CG10_big_fil_rev_8_21_14_0_10_56_12]